MRNEYDQPERNVRVCGREYIDHSQFSESVDSLVENVVRRPQTRVRLVAQMLVV